MRNRKISNIIQNYTKNYNITFGEIIHKLTEDYSLDKEISEEDICIAIDELMREWIDKKLVGLRSNKLKLELDEHNFIDCKYIIKSTNEKTKIVDMNYLYDVLNSLVLVGGSIKIELKNNEIEVINYSKKKLFNLLKGLPFKNYDYIII